MAEVNLIPSTSRRNLKPSRWSSVSVPYKIEVELDFAEAAAAKGSPLAALDEIKVMYLPDQFVVLAAGMEVTEVKAGTSADTTLDLGGIDDPINGNTFVDGFDFSGAFLGEAATAVTANFPVYSQGGEGQDQDLAVTIATQTGTLTGGKLRIWVVGCSVEPDEDPGIAQLGS